MLRKNNIKWETIEEQLNKIIPLIKKDIEGRNIENIKLLIPCRGGEIIGSLIKNSLGLPEENILRVKISNNKHNANEKGNEVIIKDNIENVMFGNFLRLINESKDDYLLFVDDLLDNGDTYNYIKEKISTKKMKGIFLFKKEGNDIKDEEVIIGKKMGKEWIVFPWEKFYLI